MRVVPARPSVLVVSAALAGACLSAVPAAAAVAPHLTEIHYDNSGTDVGEAVEITAEPGTDLTGWSVVLYNGNGGAAYGTRALSGVVGQGGAVTIDYPVDGLQNGSPDGVALVRPGGVVSEFLSYEGVMTAVGGPAGGTTSQDIGVSEGPATAVGHSLQLVDGRWVGPRESTFARPAEAPARVADCDAPPSHTAMQVQGSGSTTPLSGTQVVVQGVVVGDLQDGGLDGFHLQDGAGDGDPATSDAVFVYAPGRQQVALGDVVQVAGKVTEFGGATQVTASGLDACGTAERPAATPLPLPSTDAQREALEGMRVVAPEPLTVTDVYGLDRFGELALSQGGVLQAPTEIAEPGDEARAVAAANRQRRIVLDDGSSRSTAQAPPHLTLEDPVRVGDTAVLEDVVLGYGFSAWRLQPADGTAEGATFLATNPRTATPEQVGGRTRLASFNVLNYFTTLPSEDGRARGAVTQDGRARQEAKIVSAINRLGADVVALMEIENSAALGEQPDEALAALTRALNAEAGAGTWAYVPSAADLPPASEQDVITNALIYKPATVGLWREATALTDAPGTPAAQQVWDNAREPVAQAFVARGDRFTVVANHFKSKGSGSGAGNTDTGDGQGASNADRVGQAAAVARWVDELRSRAEDDDVVLLGDLNAYTQEDPMDVLRGAGLHDLAHERGESARSYVFNGESGSLDHALSTPQFAAKVTGVDVWNVNAVESRAYEYGGASSLYAPTPFRASDHDPVVVGFEPSPGRSRG